MTERRSARSIPASTSLADAMRNHGTLSKWNDDRGFGFVAPAAGGGELFVHVSAFPRDGRRPTVGEIVSYETESGPDGKIRAVKLMRPGGTRRAHSPRRARPERRSAKAVQALVALALAGVLLGYGYRRFTKTAPAPPAAAMTASVAEQDESRFQCDGRTVCSQMTSCAEARYFVQHCPDTKMDGNGDGEPCERQWCNADGRKRDSAP